MTTLLAIYGSGLLAALGLVLSGIGRDQRSRAARLTFSRARRARLERSVAGSRRVGPYLVEHKLGAGAMGEVYRERSAAGGGELALKLLPRDASGRERERFEQEARLGAEVRHPNVAAIFGQGEAADGTRYIAMELVEGETLQQLVEREGPLPAARVVCIAAQLCAALAHMHERGLVHRDIKPENVILMGHDRAKIVDFGLVERVGAALEPEAIVGTPLYMAPEAIVAPSSIDARSDLYALGALLYFSLRGAPVFGGSSVLEACTHHLHSTPEPPSAALGRAIPTALERLVLDCLAKDAGERPPSARALAARLEACLAPVGETQRPPAARSRARRPLPAGLRQPPAIDVGADTSPAIALGPGGRSGIRWASGDPLMNRPARPVSWPPSVARGARVVGARRAGALHGATRASVG